MHSLARFKVSQLAPNEQNSDDIVIARAGEHPASLSDHGDRVTVSPTTVPKIWALGRKHHGLHAAGAIIGHCLDLGCNFQAPADDQR